MLDFLLVYCILMWFPIQVLGMHDSTEGSLCLQPMSLDYPFISISLSLATQHKVNQNSTLALDNAPSQQISPTLFLCGSKWSIVPMIVDVESQKNYDDCIHKFRHSTFNYKSSKYLKSLHYESNTNSHPQASRKHRRKRKRNKRVFRHRATSSRIARWILCMLTLIISIVSLIPFRAPCMDAKSNKMECADDGCGWILPLYFNIVDGMWMLFND